MLTACSPQSGGGSADDDTFTIGYAALTTKEQFTSEIISTLEEAAPDLGATVVTVASEQDSGTELSNVEDLITRQVDAIIMQPVDGVVSQNAANRVIEAGIPLFLISTEFAEGADIAYEAHIGVDDTEAGVVQAEYLNELLPEGGNVVLAAGTNGASWTDRRVSGFKDTLSDNFEIVAEFQANGNRDEAKRNMEDTLQRFPHPGDIVAVVANNDEMAIGAASAIQELGRGDDVKVVVGVDGTDAALAGIADGSISATVQQDPKAQALEAISVIVDYLNGEEIENRYALPFTLITADNVQEFLK